MQWEHQLVWSCGAPAHDEVFQSASDLAIHMRLRHSGTFADGQLDAILESSARPIKDPFPSCPICLEHFSRESASLEHRTSEPDQIYLERRARDHIALHMEAIALFSLPEKPDVESSNKTQQRASQASHGTTIEEEIQSLPAIDTLSGTDSDYENMLSQDQHDFPECPKDSQGGYMEITVNDMPAKGGAEYSHDTDRRLFPFLVRTMPQMQLPLVVGRPGFVRPLEFENLLQRWLESPLLYMSNIPEARGRSLAGFILFHMQGLETQIKQPSCLVSIQVPRGPLEDVNKVVFAILGQIAEQRVESMPVVVEAVRSRPSDSHGTYAAKLLGHLRKAIGELADTAIVFMVAEYSDDVYVDAIWGFLLGMMSWKEPGLRVLVIHSSSTQSLTSDSGQNHWGVIDARDAFRSLKTPEPFLGSQGFGSDPHVYCFVPSENIDIACLAAYLGSFIDGTATVKASRHPTYKDPLGFTIGASTVLWREALEDLLGDTRAWRKEQNTREFKDRPYDYQVSGTWERRQKKDRLRCPRQKPKPKRKPQGSLVPSTIMGARAPFPRKTNGNVILPPSISSLGFIAATWVLVTSTT